MKQKLDEMRQLDISDIKQKIDALEKDVYNLRYQAQTSRAEKPHKFKELRKKIARYKTVIREKELANAGKR